MANVFLSLCNSRNFCNFGKHEGSHAAIKTWWKPKKVNWQWIAYFFDSFSKILLKYLHFMAFPFIFGDYSAIHKRIVFPKETSQTNQVTIRLFKRIRNNSLRVLEKILPEVVTTLISLSLSNFFSVEHYSCSSLRIIKGGSFKNTFCLKIANELLVWTLFKRIRTNSPRIEKKKKIFQQWSAPLISFAEISLEY